MRSLRQALVAGALAALSAAGCSREPTRPTVGVAFETLQTEFWVAAYGAIADELRTRGLDVAQAVADGDANRQLEQVKTLLARGVQGIVIVPKDAQSVIPAIRAANQARVPIVLFNRPADPSDAKSVAVVADNQGLARATVEHLCALARRAGGKRKAAILIGDLGDLNALARRDGFDEAAAACSDAIEVVARIPTEWNQEKALAGLTNALSANPDIGLVFTSSDFMLPSIASALKQADKWRPEGDAGHVILGGFDGDQTAWRMLVDGYLDATGVQDVFFESEAAVQAVMDLRAGRPVADVILDPGFVIHRANRDEKKARMWGARVAEKSEAAR